ncbi:MAG: Por Secre tail protein, partial [Bacteroidota bacterium]|nr:Por Secre tail protein [Bacteroidota bacterium]
ESYDTLGNHQIGSSGYEIAFKNYCGEQNPGAQSCHPNWTGSIMLGKAFWFMMAEVTKFYDFTGINEYNRINEYPYIEGNFTINPTIRLNLKNAADISIIVYDLLGNKLFENNAFMKDGLQSIPLNIKSGCGLYFIQVNTGNSLNYLKCAVGN